MTCDFHAAFGHHSLKNRRSPAAVNRLLETHIPTLFHAASTLSGPRQRWIGCSRKRHTCDDLPALFHTASPIQPPPLRGTSFHRKEGVSTRAPSLGRGCRAQRGGVGFLLGRRSRLLFAFPIREGRCVEKSGILVSQPSPRGEGYSSQTVKPPPQV